MSMKSNIEPVSNVYTVRKSISEDVEFHNQVRGKTALDVMLRKVKGTESSFLLADIKKMLTDEQYIQYEEGMYCSVHGDKQELVWGFINRNGKRTLECKCYKHTCSHFLKCRPDYDMSILPQAVNYDLINLNTNWDPDVTASEIDLPSAPSDELFSSVDFQSIGYGSELVIDFSDEDFDYVIDLEDKDADPQLSVVEAAKSVRMLVAAGPGTGKTHTLINRIRHLVKVQHVNVDDMIVLSFSRAAIAEIKQRLPGTLDGNEYGFDIIQNVDIRTFDSFATYLINQVDPAFDLRGIDYNKRIEIAIECIKKNPNVFDFTEHLIVDEIQDLVGVRARFVQTILEHSNCGFTFLGDMCQAIYEYQVANTPNEINAYGFHQWLTETYTSEIKKYSFNHNYRQTRELAKLGVNVRNSILNDSAFTQVHTLMKSVEFVRNLGDSRSLSINFKFDQNKKYALLCRNNGQVLNISKQLREQNIDHTIQRPSTHVILPGWIGELLGTYSRRYISYADLVELVDKAYGQGNANIKEYWQVLKNIEKGTSSEIELDKLVSEMLHNQHAYKELVSGGKSNVIVSSIHRAKGREYDTVFILENDVFDESKWTNDISAEMRTMYVALTRPKENLYRINLQSSWQRKIRDRRWISTGYRNKPYVSHIEVGLEKDIEPSSFVDTSIHGSESAVMEIQQYIQNVKPGDAVVLIKDIINSSVVYKIYHDGTLIGSMTSNFTDDLFQSFKEVQKYYSPEKHELYPSEIVEIYVDEICTYCLPSNGINVPQQFRNSKIWNGLHLTGLGRIIK